MRGLGNQKFFMVIDTETTIKGKVADFGAVIVNSKGEIQEECSIMVSDFFHEELFYNPKDTGFWGKQAAETRKAAYNEMLKQGIRSMASVSAINAWIAKAVAKYGRHLSWTAYNSAFDNGCMKKSGIITDCIADTFCLWGAAIGNIATKKSYRDFVLENHYFSDRTEKTGSMTMRTNAEVMAAYVRGYYSEEPHTAREDLDFEVDILIRVLKCKKWRDNIKAFNYRDFQLKGNFKSN
jgi:hypothetical protein